MEAKYMQLPSTYALLNSDEERDAVVVDKQEHTTLIESTGAKTNSASRLSCFVNLANTIVGSGMLGLPYAFSNTGWILGSVLLLLSAITTVFSLHCLSVCALKTNVPSSFYTVTLATIPQFTFLIDLSVVLACFGVGISYLIVVGGLMPAVMAQFGVTDMVWRSRETWVVIGFIVVFPLCCLRNLDALRYTSFFAVVCAAFLAVLIFLYAVPSVGLDACAGYDETSGVDCVGETVLANIFAVVNEMSQPTVHRINTVIFAAIFAANCIYATVAISGYSTYGSHVASNILTSYPKTPITSTVRICVSLLVMFSYPVVCHPARRSALTLWASAFDKPGEHISALSGKVRYAVTTGIFLFGTFGIAMILDDLGVVLALVGATGSTIKVCILPGISYYLLHKDEGPSVKLYLSLLLFLAGLVIMPLCVVFIFL